MIRDNVVDTCAHYHSSSSQILGAEDVMFKDFYFSISVYIQYIYAGIYMWITCNIQGIEI